MLSVSQKTRYGMTSIYELALQYHNEPVQIRAIADQYSVPQKYLEQVLLKLKRAGLVKSFRGTNGGYVLAKPPEKMMVLEVVEALEGPIDIAGAQGASEALGFFWKKAELELSHIFQQSIADLLSEKQRSEQATMYAI